MSSDLSSAKKILSPKHIAIAILIIVSIGVYLNTLPNEFVYDDIAQVLENKWIKDIRYIPEIFLTNVWAFVGNENLSNYYRPLMHIIYMIDYYIFGLKPWGFHLTNIIFHAGVTLLVFLIVSTLVNQLQISNLKSNPEQIGTNLKSKILSAPFIAALLFAAHPIHTETVAWVAGIPELSFTLFYLLSFYFYINSNKRYTPLNPSTSHRPLDRGENKNKRGGKRIILSVFFFFLATLSKETALTLPLLLLAYDYSISRSPVYGSLFTVHSIIKKYLPYLIVSGIYFILRIYALGGFAPQPKRHTQLSNYEYFINVFPLFTKYLEKLLVPINMNAFYVFHPISSIFQLKGITALVLTLGFIFLIYFFRRNKVVFLSLLWIVIPLLSVLYIPALGENTFTDRYLYLPSIGFVVLVSLTIERISQLNILRQTVNYVIISILVILTGLYSVGTIKRNYIWKDNYSLWTDTTKKSPDSSMAHNNLGLACHNRNLIDKGIEHYQIALKLKPDYPEAHNNIANAYSEKGEFDKAFKHYQIILELNPNFSEVHNNLGLSYYKKGEIDKAIEHYQIAIKLKQGSPVAHNNLGTIHSKYGRFDDAIKEYTKALKLKPDYAEAHNNLGNIYFKQQRFDEAIKEYIIAIKLNPNDPDLHYNLAIAYSKQGRFEHAIKEYIIAIDFKPDYVIAYYNLGNAYFALGRFDEAIKEYLIAIKLKPDFPEPHNDLGNVYANQGRFNEAISEYMTALRFKPDYAEAHNNLGNAYAVQGKLDEAIKEYLIVLKLTPEDAETYNNLANAYSEMGELNKAIEHFQSALRLKSDYLEAHYNLGLVYLETGLRHKAEEEFKTALKLRPDFTPAREALESIKGER